MSSPSDLEKAIAAWRRPFEHNTAFSSENLEELESSLRNRVDALLVAGLLDDSAVLAAAVGVLRMELARFAAWKLDQ